MRRLLSFCLLACAAAAPAAAQEKVWDDRGGEGIIKPKMSYPVGNPDAIARIMWGSMRLAEAKQEACRQFGCLIVVNDSRSYRLQEFYVRPVDPRSANDWGPNQLDRPLRAREAAIRIKLPGERFCNWPVRFVVRNPKTKEVFPIEMTASLCVAPRHDTVLRLRILKPDVQVAPPDGAPET